MKNFIMDGDRIELPAPYDRLSGQGAQVGQIFGVCVTDALSTVKVVLKRKGVFDLAKIGSQAWTAGDIVYWDNTNKRLTKTASGNLMVGVAVLDVGSGAGLTTGRALLHGTPRPNEA